MRISLISQKVSSKNQSKIQFLIFGLTLTKKLIIGPLKKLVRFYQTMNEIELKIDSN